MIGLLALAALALAALLFVALPLVREPSIADTVPTLTDEQRERLALREQRDAAYAALRELELDHRTGKLTDEDHVRARDALRAEAVEALRRLEALEGSPTAGAVADDAGPLDAAAAAHPPA